MGVELTKIWGYGHHETMVMGHFESWVPLDPCFCLVFLMINLSTQSTNTQSTNSSISITSKNYGSRHCHNPSTIKVDIVTTMANSSRLLNFLSHPFLG